MTGAINSSLTMSAKATAVGPPALKLHVEADGLYEVSTDQMAAAGWELGEIDPELLALSVGGDAVAAWVVGDEDGQLDSGDTLRFYGQAMTGPYTRTNVYWLTVGAEPGLRMATRDVAPTGGAPLAESFATTVRAEEDLSYWQNPPGREAQDHWYWSDRLNAGDSADLPVAVPPFVGASANLRVRLAGRTDDAATEPDHHTRVLVNGTEVDDALWKGFEEYLHEVSIDASLLTAGDNTVTVESVGGTGAVVDTIYANWVEMELQAAYTAVENRLLFAAPQAGPHRFEVDGFSTDDLVVLDVTDSRRPVRLTGAAFSSDGGDVTAELVDTAVAESQYLAVAAAAALAPQVAADAPSDLRAGWNGADLIVIAHGDFVEDLQPLADFRRSKGWRVAVVDVHDVYDEFNDGVFSPLTIRDFLAHAYQTWLPPAPTGVLLVGDASLDFLDRFGEGDQNWVPTFVFDADDVGETANDTYFACVDGDDGLPDLMVGRFPARSSADVQAMVAKTIAYEEGPSGEPWQARSLHVADDDETEFEEASDFWIRQLPCGFESSRVYVGSYPPGDPTDDIVSALNNGVLVVTYDGHGNQDRWGTWADGRIFATSDLGRLENADRLSFVATANCLNGFFLNPIVPYSISEELLRGSTGAVGAWSPSALGLPVYHTSLFYDMLNALSHQLQPTLGSTTTAAKLRSAARGLPQELLDTFTLFGDPMTELKVARPCRTTPRSGERVPR